MSEEKKNIEKKNLKENMANDEIKTETIVKNKTKIEHKKINKNIIITVFIMNIILFFLVFSVIFALLNINNNRILNNVSIMGIDVGNMTIEEALKRLNEKEKKIIIKRYFDGRTQMEVADEIGISQAQVSRLEKNALENIKRYYK